MNVENFVTGLGEGVTLKAPVLETASEAVGYAAGITAIGVGVVLAARWLFNKI